MKSSTFVDENTALVDEREETLFLADGTLHVKRWIPRGLERRTPLILFHDSIGCVQMWRRFPEALCRRLRREVIAYDRLGFGRSSARRDRPSVGFIFEESERYFPALRGQLGISEFIVYGHSVGGSMAVVIAAKYVSECLAVVTEAAQAFVEPQTLEAIAKAKIKFRAPDELAKLQNFHGDKARWVVDFWTDTWLNPQFRDWAITSEIATLACPLLAIHGGEDEYGSIAFPEALTRTAGRSEKVLLVGCGHVPHREREASVLDRVEQFLRHALPLNK